MNVISLFSGCGGLDLGFERAGFRVVLANEYDKTIWPTYRENFPQTQLIAGDIRAVTAAMIDEAVQRVAGLESAVAVGPLTPREVTGRGEIVGIIGGPPCQSWSAAGSKRGIDDPRGRLFYEYIRILRHVRPRFFLAENVMGMLAARNDAALQSILAELRASGYRVTLHFVDAADYGAPQERRRVLYIGFRSDLTIDFALPPGASSRLTLRDAIADLAATAVPALARNHHNPAALNNNEYFVGGYSSRYMSRNRRRGWDEQAFTVQASGRQCQLHPSAPPMERVGCDHWRFAAGCEHLYRRLTVREVARLQGFPDDFAFLYKNVNDAYKMIGNAVPVPLAQTVATAIRAALQK